MMSHKNSVISGVKWTSASHVVGRLLSLSNSILLARLLVPSDFGLIAMAMVIVGFVDIFSSLGTSAAVIQRDTLSKELLSSLFWFNVLFGLAAAGVLYALSSTAADFYREPRLTEIMHWLSLTLFLGGIKSVPLAVMQRELSFERLAKLEIATSCFSLIVGGGAALMGMGVWSLVIQTLAVNTLMAILLWMLSDWRPQFVCRWGLLRSVAGFSLNLTGYNLFNYFARNADNFLIGRFLGAQSLGYYDLGYRLLLYPLGAISAVVGRVVLPAYARIQNDNAQLSRSFVKVTVSIAMFSFPMMLGLMAISEPFVLTFFGPTWAPMIPVLTIFAGLGAIQSILSMVGAIYQAKGRTDLLLRWGIASGLLIVASFVIGLQWGIVGVAAAYALASLLLTYPCVAIPFRLIGLPVKTLSVALWPPMAATLIMLVVVLALKAALSPAFLPAMNLAVLVCAGAVSYAIASWCVNRCNLLELRATFRLRS